MFLAVGCPMNLRGIESGQGMDRVRVHTSRRRSIVKLFSVALPWIGPKVARWLDATEAVAASRLRMAEVRRGDLVRDVSVEGRLRAADSQVLGTVGFDDEEPSGLRQSQRVSVRLILEEKANVLKVPRGPFLESGCGRVVYRVREDRAEKTLIEIGAISITEIEILHSSQSLAGGVVAG